MLSALQTNEHLIRIAESLPAAPRIMSRLHRLLLDSRSGWVEIAQLLKCDPALTTRLVRIANSPMYQGRGIGSVEGALQRVGFGEVFRLVGVAVNASLGDGDLRCYGYTAEQFRAHNLASALLAERVARQMGLDTRLAYTAGLLRCLGQLVLDLSLRGKIAADDTLPMAGGLDVVEWESRMFGLTHYEVGAILLRHWDFAPEVVEAVGAELSLETQPGSLADALILAGWLVQLADFGLEARAMEWSVVELRFAAIGWSRDEALAVSLETATQVLRLLAL